MHLTLNWKFYLTILISLCGVVVPIWIWQADQSTREIQLKLVSETALSPPAKLEGLTLTINGKAIKDPYLSIIELSNKGNRPILKADFERALEIIPQPSVSLAQVNVSDIYPKDLKPEVITKDEKIYLQPLLLNPNDKVQLTLLSTGGQPKLSVQSRIAGISSVEMINQSNSSKKSIKLWLALIISALLFSAYLNACFEFLESIRQKTTIFYPFLTIIGASFGSILLVKPFQDTYGTTTLQVILGMVLISVISMPFIMKNRRLKFRARE